MADHNIEGHFAALLRLRTSGPWKSLWESLSIETETFEGLGLPHEASDRDLWQACQQHDLVLLIANRNDEAKWGTFLNERNNSVGRKRQKTSCREEDSTVGKIGTVSLF